MSHTASLPLSVSPSAEGTGPAPEARSGAPEMMIVDEEGRLCWMNAAKRQRLGPNLAEHLLGRRCSEAPEVCLHSCGEVCEVRRLMRERDPSLPASCWRTMPQTGIPMRVEFSPVILPGERQLLAVRHAPMPPPEHGEMVGDSADRRGLWAAMAALTMGLAHEMRNPLTALEMRLAALRLRPGYGLNEAGKGAVAEVTELVRRVGKLIENLCNFSPNQTIAPVDVNPGAAVREALNENAAPLCGIGVRVIDENRRVVHIDASQFRAILDHLIRNAAAAMLGKGQLTITLTNRGGWCLIDLGDTGPGIPPEIQSRLGQPFVSTKPPGHGAGLGLSLTQLYLDRHGGHLRMIRTGPEGTTMRVALPGFDHIEEATT
jgi:signal transduction histidine kinase